MPVVAEGDGGFPSVLGVEDAGVVGVPVVPGAVEAVALGVVEAFGGFDAPAPPPPGSAACAVQPAASATAAAASTTLRMTDVVRFIVAPRDESCVRRDASRARAVAYARTKIGRWRGKLRAGSQRAVHRRPRARRYSPTRGSVPLGGRSIGKAQHMARESESGLPIEPVYGPGALEGWDPAGKLGEPGAYPFTRGVYPSMYTGRPWTMRQYAGFGTASESNARYKQLIANGTMGLSVAFDLPTQMGHDSDAPISSGEVGKVGVAIDSIDDMRVLFDGIPLDKVSTSMTINAPGSLLLLLYQLVGEEQGVPADQLTGTIQNDVLKEYIARGTYIFPPKPSLRLIADIFKYCRAEIPKWNTISISGYHMAEAGASPAQEIAFTLADGIEYVRTAVAAGMDVDDFAPRLSFFFVARTTILEEVAKFRAARRIWARVMKEEFGAKNPKSLMLRFHTQTAGVQLTAQQPEVNLVRVAVQGLAAVLGGTQSLHTNSFDEAIALPTDKSARLALRTQQVLAYETDVTATVDPFAGSYVVEKMTDDVEAAALELMAKVEAMGGAVAAIERGFQKGEIERSAYRIAQQTDSGERVVVGVNRYTIDVEEPYEHLRVDPAIEAQQAERLAALRAERDQEAVDAALAELRRAAEGTDNVLYPMKDALRARATVGEVCNALREVWGTYVPSDAF
ncbi:methylmalonyl-CoA mutase [Streptomyces gardneri]|uniref:Methylmalonyl-CoA mutase n=9 Tax=Streptomyces TaxID=1883 RepID=A0A4Y3RX93_9ACTN|nr:methylmalonyl-CoA mutase [Streptomyces gardneri]GHH11105.1 methylmalonyl-CoA mutase [Streptomyces gardneri]